MGPKDDFLKGKLKEAIATGKVQPVRMPGAPNSLPKGVESVRFPGAPSNLPKGIESVRLPRSHAEAVERATPAKNIDVKAVAAHKEMLAKQKIKTVQDLSDLANSLNSMRKPPVKNAPMSKSVLKETPMKKAPVKKVPLSKAPVRKVSKKSDDSAKYKADYEKKYPKKKK